MPYDYGQIVGIHVYKSDTVVVRKGHGAGHDPIDRGDIVEFSKASRQRLAFVASNTDVVFRTMVTLTYPEEYPTDGTKVKKHLRRFIKWMRRQWGGCDVLWFLEFQKRGAPHIHVLTDYPLPRQQATKRMVYRSISEKWFQICDTGDPKHRVAGTRTERLRSPEGGAHYAVKYATKMRQKAVPPGYRKCGRFWGHTQAVAPKVKGVHRCTEDDIRGVLEKWQYAPSEEHQLWRVLFNTASLFETDDTSTIDRPDKSGYTGSETQLVRAPSKQETRKERDDDGLL